MNWLQEFLGPGCPAILTFSIMLPGNHSGEDFPPLLSPLDEVWKKLGRAELLIELGHCEEARIELERADSLVENLHPHTPQFERVAAFKTHLWELLKRSG
jgi:hypothetical protein